MSQRRLKFQDLNQGKGSFKVLIRGGSGRGYS